MIKCDYDCASCGKYSIATYNGAEYEEFECLRTGKIVTKYFDENGEVERTEIFPER